MSKKPARLQPKKEVSVNYNMFIISVIVTVIICYLITPPLNLMATVI